MNCPLCGEPSTDVVKLKCSDFDGSPLYQNIRIQSCNGCNHVFNELTDYEKRCLDLYYEQESSVINISGATKYGDLPGSDNALSVARYERLFEFLSPYLDREMKILDVGCGMGGFVRYLQNRMFSHAEGLDYVANYTVYAEKTGSGRFTTASAYSLPFNDDYYDFLIIDHVLEHLVDPITALKEVVRITKPGGMIFLGVPESSRYREYPFFDFFWFCLREHIHHFDAAIISFITSRMGLRQVDQSLIFTEMMSNKMILPNYLSLFKKAKKPVNEGFSGSETLVAEIKKYVSIENAFLQQRQSIIKNLIDQNAHVYVWGIGKEFFYLYANTDLNRCINLTLIDNNEVKQTTMKVNGHDIKAPSALRNATADAKLIVTAVAHSESIMKDARMLGFEGEVIMLDRGEQ